MRNYKHFRSATTCHTLSVLNKKTSKIKNSVFLQDRKTIFLKPSLHIVKKLAGAFSKRQFSYSSPGVYTHTVFSVCNAVVSVYQYFETSQSPKKKGPTYQWRTFPMQSHMLLQYHLIWTVISQEGPTWQEPVQCVCRLASSQAHKLARPRQHGCVHVSAQVLSYLRALHVWAALFHSAEV